MGRSRVVSRSADEDSNPGKSKRKKTSSSPVNVGAPFSTGEVANERKAGLYHCNNCDKDLSGFIRFKCAVCVDYDLCVECFSIGAELYPHKSNHPYRVMDNLSFPFISPDWNADEEILLLEGIATYGFGNWQEVADHIGSKTKADCISHYNSAYMNSKCFPLPDLSRVTGKSKNELLAMAKESAVKREVAAPPEIPLKEELSSSTSIKHENSSKDEDTAHESSPSVPGVKKNVSGPLAKDNIKLEVAEQQSDRSIGEKKPKFAGDQAPSSIGMYGYNSKRQEFEIEYDNDAEQLLADMEFKDTDTDAERKLKLEVLHIYLKRLDERKRRKDFVLERNLLHSDSFEMSLSPEEKQIYNRYKVFARFHSKEEHKELLESIIEEHRILRRIQDLQEARTASCRTATEANRFIEEKRKKEAEESAQRLSQAAPSSIAGKALKSPRGLPKNSLPFGADTLSRVTGPIVAKSLDNWDVSGLLGANLLSETEKQLCNEIRILPVHYLKMLQTLSTEIKKGKVKQKSDAYSLFKVDPHKVDKVFDMLIEKGIAQSVTL